MSKYNFNSIEKKWQKKWEEGKIFEAKDFVDGKKKFYVLDMFPYPSGAGLHIGHAFVFSLGDIFARFKRMQGFNVLYPIGYDALGLPAENAAIKVGEHPSDYNKKTITNFMKQQKAMGWSYDWSRLIRTDDADFYKWDQWIFLKMLEKGIAYRKKSAVNWCSKCQSVLANEQVVGGKCWRHEDTDVEIRHLDQWFFKITNYAERLLEGLEKIDWPENAKTLQKNWIGKSHGTEIDFEINSEKWKIFTTRPDTIYGVTFMVVSAQHSKLMELVTKEQIKEVEKFLKKIKSTSEKDFGDLEKEGVFTGSYAINPITKERIPVWAGNFVVADYGSGMVMAVPANCIRDYEFAIKYNLPIKEVIKGKLPGKINVQEIEKATGELINSDKFNGMNNLDAIDEITKFLEKKKSGKKVVQYKLRDWLISRQRYWGTPIPVVYCDKCGIVSIPEKDLPVKLPKDVKFGKGNPLLTNEKWINTKCPKCKGEARRETDTMDTFANSSWYYLRYTDPKNDKKIFDEKKVDYWTPIDQYIGGPEHITMHLIYMRFYAKFLKDLGLIKFDEPALRYFTQGLVKASDGEKMSKSRGNIVEPLVTIKKYGADSLRLYLVSASSSDRDFNWDENGIKGTFKFLTSVYEYFEKLKFGETTPKLESKLNKIIKEVTEYVQNFKHNLAVIKIRELFGYFSEEKIDKKTAESFLKLLHIYCPFVTEELWADLRNKKFISIAEWPVSDEKKINPEFEKQEQAIEKLSEDINNVSRIVSEKQNKKIHRVFVYVLPFEKKLFSENAKLISKKTNLDVEVFAVNDKDKFDPENKSKNVKPGRPGIYLE